MSYQIKFSNKAPLRAHELSNGDIFHIEKTLAEAIKSQVILMVVKSSSVDEEDLQVFNLYTKEPLKLEADWEVSLCDVSIDFRVKPVVMN